MKHRSRARATTNLPAILLLLGACLAGSFEASAAPATNPPAAPARSSIRTNPPAKALPAGKKAGTNIVAGQKKAAGTNAVASGTNTVAWNIETLKKLPDHPAFYPVIGCLVIGLVALVVYRVSKRKEKAAPGVASTPTARAAKRASKKAVHACNVLELMPEASRVWHFDARGKGFILRGQETTSPGRTLPQGIVAKDWRTLLKPRLNIAWLPHENVFLRVVRLPQSDFEETLSMVELQMEKLSPMPVAQVAWSFQVLQQTQGLQTVVVMMVSRAFVEEFLGKLEGQGYLADRLELPLLDQLQATPITDDGAYIYPEPRTAGAGGNATALVAWWYGGTLQNLDLLTLPERGPAESVKEQVLQMAWAGELEGWLTAPPRWHLVADGETAALWEPALREGLDQPIEREQPLASGELAALTARRGAQSDPRTNLLPFEYAERYRNQYFDRLWMRGVGAVIGIYVIGVAIYFVALYVMGHQTKAVENTVAGLGTEYTNSLRLRDQYAVLKDRQELKFAALDTWSTAARLLPEDLKLDNMSFSDGKRITLSGSAPTDQVKALLDFEAAMRRASANGELLFDPNRGDNLIYRQVQTPAGPVVTWNFGLELKRTEVQ